MTVLIDSWAWIEYLKASPIGEEIKAHLESDEDLITTTMNLAEVYKFLLAEKPQSAGHLIQQVFKISHIINLNPEIALHAAKIKHEKKMGMADAIVAATAEKENAKILTGDPDFIGFTNLIFLKKK